MNTVTEVLDNKTLTIWVDPDNYHKNLYRVQWYDHINKTSFVALFEHIDDANEFYYYMIKILNAN